MSPAGMPGVAPAILEEGGIRPGGAKGNALFFTDTNRGFLGKDVGSTSARSRSASICGFMPPGIRKLAVLNHRDDDNSGGAGYKLNLEKNHLSFYMMHSWPYNMLHVVSKAQVPVKEWTHVAMTYDGSSRAAGITLYVNGRPPKSMWSMIISRKASSASFAAVFNEFVGVESGAGSAKSHLKTAGSTRSASSTGL